MGDGPSGLGLERDGHGDVRRRKSRRGNKAGVAAEMHHPAGRGRRRRRRGHPVEDWAVPTLRNRV